MREAAYRGAVRPAKRGDEMTPIKHSRGASKSSSAESSSENWSGEIGYLY